MLVWQTEYGADRVVAMRTRAAFRLRIRRVSASSLGEAEPSRPMERRLGEAVGIDSFFARPRLRGEAFQVPDPQKISGEALGPSTDHAPGGASCLLQHDDT